MIHSTQTSPLQQNVSDKMSSGLQVRGPQLHTLLRHLEKIGFSAVPQVVGDGFDEDGNEVLTWVEGEAEKGSAVDPRDRLTTTWGELRIWSSTFMRS